MNIKFQFLVLVCLTIPAALSGVAATTAADSSTTTPDATTTAEATTTGDVSGTTLAAGTTTTAQDGTAGSDATTAQSNTGGTSVSTFAQDTSTAEGVTTAQDLTTTAEGFTTAQGQTTTAEGVTTAQGQTTTGEGGITAQTTTAEGVTTAQGQTTTAEGGITAQTTAAEGVTTAEDQTATAEGVTTAQATTAEETEDTTVEQDMQTTADTSAAGDTESTTAVQDGPTTDGTTEAQDEQATTEGTTTDPLCTAVNCNFGACVDGMCECDWLAIGEFCDILIPFYDEWSIFSEPMQNCGTTFKMRTRNCTDISGALRAPIDCMFYGEAEEYQEVTLKDCTCNVHPCSDAFGEHSDAACNLPGTGNIHTCYEHFDNSKFLCQPKCLCADGYTSSADGASCLDINECDIKGTACYEEGTNILKKSVSQCLNLPGSYGCLCAQGYRIYKSNITICVDINECEENLDNCDEEDRATCTNTDGGFKCACNPGFSGDGHYCTYDRFLWKNYTRDYSSRVLPTSSNYVTPMEFISCGYLSSDDKNSVINSFYATISGLIIFTAYKSSDPYVQNAFPQPNRDGLLYWSENNLRIINPLIVKIAAVYWTDSKIASGGGVYTKFIQNADTANFPNAKTLNADWVYVVTWERMTPNTDPVDETQTNTFQAVVYGDKARRTIAILYIYQDRAMKWDLALWGSVSQTFYPARIGTAFRGSAGNGVAEEYQYSGFPASSQISKSAWLDYRAKIAYVDRYSYPNQTQNILENGRFMFTITAMDRTYTSPCLTCQPWLSYQELVYDFVWQSYLSAYAALCPSSITQVQEVLFLSYKPVSKASNYVCYEFTRRFTWKNRQYSPRCCFDNFGALAPDSISFVGSLYGENTMIAYDPDQSISDNEAFTACCGERNLKYGLTPIGMCYSYLRFRPACNSWLFRALAIAQARGDPHITTLDGLTYTFNGHGEYTLVATNGGVFNLQGRIEPVGSPPGATVFTGFAGRFGNGTTAQVNLNSAGVALELWINGSLKTGHNWNNITTFGDVTVTQDAEKIYAIVFDNGVTVKVNASFEMKLLTFSLIMPPELKNKTVGLMGNYDDDAFNDIFNSSGTSISANSTEEEIFYLSRTWATDKNTTLFSYNSSTNFEDFNKPDFIPKFFNPNLTAMFQNDTERMTAIELCNPSGGGADSNPSLRKECYFDFSVTKNAAVARATMAASTALSKIKAELANYPPTIHNANVALQVEVGVSYQSLVVINATDRNEGDVISFNKESGPSQLSVSSNGEISWSAVVFSANDSVIITVTDGKSSSVFSPQVAICNCKNGGTCIWDAKNSQNWYVAKCECQHGWVGDFCDEDVDGCADRPCFTACTDVPAKQVQTKGVDFICDPCPTGLAGDGQHCFDVNECLSKPCAQNCENTAGSFQCSCNTGYALGVDGRLCTDINECLLTTDECDKNAVCTNTIGGYNCTCNPGYKGSGHEGFCSNIDECLDGTASCPAHSKCADTDGSYACICDFGYKKEGTECADINECALGNKCDQNCLDGIGAYTCACYPNFILNDTNKVTCHPEKECSAGEKASCDNGNSRSMCGKDSSDAVLCICPKGYVLDNSKICQDINECVTGDHICSAVTSTCNNTSPGYVCQCKMGFRRSSDGVTCEDIDECADKSSSCSQVCKNVVGSYRCECQDGYRLNSNGYSCDDVNECASSLTNACDKLKGSCTNTNKTSANPLGYSCGCLPGYTVSADGFTCVDINECSLASRGGCKQGCVNADGAYSCICGKGYVLNSDGKTCDDVDECSSDTTNYCYSSLHCNNTIGGYQCSCPEGFELKSDGFTCDSITDCQPNNCSYSCSVLQGIDLCQCPRGYSLDTSDNVTCIDKDECLLGLHNCLASNNVKCVNMEPGFACSCISSSYKQLESTKCIDVDECFGGNYSCPTHSYCSNKSPGYDCICEQGFTKVGSLCTDIDECEQANECSYKLGTCTNKEGGYSCSCKEGYQGDGITCTDVNECAAENNCEKSAERGYCNNTIGSYTCGCYPGYIMNSSNNNCEDINECINQNLYGIKCQQQCVNVPGSWKCGCSTGFQLSSDGYSCSALVSCNAGNPCNQNCFKLNGIDTCVCNTGYELSSDNATCLDIDECKQNLSTCDRSLGICSNTLGSYSCSCSQQYTLGPSNECQDRDGGYGVWTEWSSCSAECGNDGVKVRNRSCDNPSQQGFGNPCDGEPLEKAECNHILCAEQLESGIEIKLTGITRKQFDVALGSFKMTAAGAINNHCTSSASNAEHCCQSSVRLKSPENLVFLTGSALDIWTADRVLTVGVRVVVVATFVRTQNPVCINTLDGTRKKRAVNLLDQMTLLDILSNKDTLNSIVVSVQSEILRATGESVIITAENPSVPLQVTTAPTVTPTEAPTSKPPLAWVIPVAVIGGLIVITIIVVITVVLIKKRAKKVIHHDEVEDAEDTHHGRQGSPNEN